MQNTQSLNKNLKNIDTEIDRSVQTSQALQILMQNAQLMIQLSLIQDKILQQLGLGKDFLQKWQQSLPNSIKDVLSKFAQEVELVEKQAEININYSTNKNN